MKDDLEDRVRALELQLGLDESSLSSDDMEKRLSALEQRYKAMYKSTLRKDWSESVKLLEELDPNTALTHQQQIAAPILYRRQEILASADSFREDLQELSKILSLLMIGQEPPKDGKTISEQQVVQAPILTQTTVPEEDIQRLDGLATTVVDLQLRLDAATGRLDCILDRYLSLVSAISSKTVQIDEELKRRGIP